MKPELFNIKARELIIDYVDEHLDKSVRIPLFDVFIIWSCSILDNNKAMLSTTLPDRMYYEIVYNSATRKICLDAYKKKKNKVILQNAKIGGMESFISKCKYEIQEHLMNEVDLFADIEICTLWSCKTLQNYKAIFAVFGIVEPMYFEITYNGDKSEAYFDAYKKFESTSVLIED